MRVKLNYSLEMEEVPELIESMVARVRKELVSCLSKNFDINNPREFIANAEEVRASLFGIDSTMDECTKILSGFIQRHMQAVSQSEEQPEATPKEEEEQQEASEDTEDA
jgi:hypothetical protein